MRLRSRSGSMVVSTVWGLAALGESYLERARRTVPLTHPHLIEPGVVTLSNSPALSVTRINCKGVGWIW